MAIAEACHNKIIFNLYQSVFASLKTHIEQVQEETNANEERLDSLHEKLYSAILAKDTKNAGICAENILKIWYRRREKTKRSEKL